MPYIGRDLNRGNYLKLDDISSSFNSSTKTFNLTVGGSAFTPGSAFSILVSVGGVIQEPESAYQVNNSEITFANAPTAQDSFFCIALGVALGIGVPGNGTVNGTQLAKPFNYDGYFYLDDTNNRVGINSSSPTVALDVVGDVNVSGNISGIGGTLGGTLIGNVYASSGISTFNDLLVNGNLTVEGDTTTLNTTLRNVELLRVSAASTLPAGIITQTNTGDILRLYDSANEVFKVADGGVTQIIKGTSGGATANADAPLILDNSSHTYVQFRSPATKEQGLLFGDDADNDVGNIIYNHTNNALTFATNGGGEKLRITSAGDVGIGTDNPASNMNLHVLDKTDRCYVTFESGGNESSQLWLKNPARTWKISNYYDQNSLTFTDDSDERLRIDSSGRVIIADDGSGGTADTNADNFVVKNYDNSSSCGISILNADNQNSTLYFGNASDSKHAEIVWSDASNLFLIGASNAGASIKFRTANQADAVLIDSSGNVGIGTVTPSKALHVDGTIFASGATTSLDGGLRIQPNNDGTNYGGVIYGGAHNDNNHAIYMRRGQDGLGNTVDINSYAIFRVLTGGALASQEERLRITNQGLIGINYPNTTTGLTISKYGTLPVPNGNTYPYPAGKWSSTWNTTTANNEDYWVGFTGSYNVSSATVNICLQPNTFNFSTQQGMYIAGEATSTSSADFTVGKLIGGSVGGASTVAGTKRATKDELFRIKSDGKVGIATETGSGLINTRHAGTNQQVLHIRADLGSSNGRSLNLFTPDTDNTTAPFRFQTGNGYLFQCDSEDVFTINHDRLVGVGTNSPAANLHVKGSGTDVLKIESTDAGAQGVNLILQHSPGATNMADNDVISLIQFAGKDDSNNTTTYASIRAVATDVSNNSESGDITFHTRNAGTFAERVRIKSTGFVQIGAAANAAEAPLHVTAENSQGINAIFGAKDFVFVDNYNYDGANIALQGRDADDNDTGAGIQFTTRNLGQTATAGGTNWLHGAIIQDVYGYLRFITGGAGTTAGTEKVTITTGGTVGIGITTPEANSLLFLNKSTGAKMTMQCNDSSESWINFSGASNEMSAGFDKPGNRFVIANHDTITSNERVIITSGGKVRIGGDGSPTYNLDVKGSGQQTILIGSTDANGAYLTLDGDSNGDGSGGDYCSIGMKTDGNLQISADNPNSDANIIFLAGNSAEKARLYATQGVYMRTQTAFTNEAGNLTSGVAYDNRTRLYPYWVSETGACRFHFSATANSGIAQPRFWLFTNGTNHLTGKIEIGMNQRTNSPNNATFRNHQSTWQVAMYGEGDNDGQQMRYNNLEGTQRGSITSSTYGNYYVSSNAHSEYGTNDNQYQDGYGGWYWKMDGTGNSVQAHRFHFDCYFSGGGFNTWYMYIDQ